MKVKYSVRNYNPCKYAINGPKQGELNLPEIPEEGTCVEVSPGNWLLVRWVREGRTILQVFYGPIKIVYGFEGKIKETRNGCTESVHLINGGIIPLPTIPNKGDYIYFMEPVEPESVATHYPDTLRHERVKKVRIYSGSFPKVETENSHRYGAYHSSGNTIDVLRRGYTQEVAHFGNLMDVLRRELWIFKGIRIDESPNYFCYLPFFSFRGKCWIFYKDKFPEICSLVVTTSDNGKLLITLLRGDFGSEGSETLQTFSDVRKRLNQIL
ncbi:MAG: hypothetical protein ABIA11_01615 [Patescibacteria group bacterium]